MKIDRFNRFGEPFAFKDLKCGELLSSDDQRGVFMRIQTHVTCINAVDISDGDVMQFDDTDKVWSVND